MHKNGIKHTLVPPYHPQSNGAAERSVRVVKESLTKQVLEGKKGLSMKHRLANFLLRYRTTPHSTTGVTPAELMVKRQLRTRLSLVKPNLAQFVETKQAKQKEHKDSKLSKERLYEISDKVRVRNTRSRSQFEKWIPGTVVKICGPRTYIVKTGYRNRYVHTDHMIKAHDDISDKAIETEVTIPDSCEQPGHENRDKIRADVSIVPDSVSLFPEPSVPSDDIVSETVSTPIVLRRSQRIRKAVDRLDL
ncbi:uncharacterized protein K02A2.6 [Exaiptasia diaphana]|uniref:Integrase catalytic domain-containing protein n=1 Tax=Exaiptasia diaphana TaxID=2652724 RepID=A0A913XY72_EXADI|nr:uncharacterized protein K02A2.6 [Exaiptasia diaphana]